MRAIRNKPGTLCWYLRPVVIALRFYQQPISSYTRPPLSPCAALFACTPLLFISSKFEHHKLIRRFYDCKSAQQRQSHLTRKTNTHSAVPNDVCAICVRTWIDGWLVAAIRVGTKTTFCERENKKKRHSRRLHASVYSIFEAATCQVILYIFLFEAICSFRTSHDMAHIHSATHGILFQSIPWWKNVSEFFSSNPLPQ